jgi:hypothetical protein
MEPDPDAPPVNLTEVLWAVAVIVFIVVVFAR